MNISDKALEDSAMDIHRSRWPNAPWECLDSKSRRHVTTNARAALEAAARKDMSCQGCGAALKLEGSTEQIVSAFIDIHMDCETPANAN